MTRGTFAAALALAVLLLAPARASTGRVPSYSFRDLGTLGGSVTAAADVNAYGQVAGVSMTTDGFLHAFLWSKGKMTDLGTLGGQSSYATALNDSGTVVGYSQLVGKPGSHAFVWRKGTGMRDLGTLGGSQSFANDVNDGGVVVGRAFDPSDTPRGFVWRPTTGMKKLEGDPFSVATAVGARADGPIGGSAGVELDPGTWAGTGAPFRPLPLLAPYESGEVHAVDVRGDVVGAMTALGGSAPGTRAFFYDSHRMRALGALGSLTQSEAYSISNSLRIVGIAYTDVFESTVGWVARSPTAPLRPLGDLGGRPGWALSGAASINDLGQIVGTGFHNGRTRGFLLTPDRKERAASLRAFASGGRLFHARVSRTLARALVTISRHKSRACASLRKLAKAAERERTLTQPARRIFAADVRAFAAGLSCGR